MTDCLCEFVSSLWVQLWQQLPASREASMEAVLDKLATSQIQMELQDRRCVAEAKRLHASGAKTLFRAKMLEHRRVQAQLLQLHRYRENVLAHMDAINNHEINQTFVKAMQNAVKTHKQYAYTRDDATSTMDNLHDSMSMAKEMTELLGQPIGGDVMDEELEQEFLDEIAPAEAEKQQLLLPAAPEVSIRMEPHRLVIPLAAASG